MQTKVDHACTRQFRKCPGVSERAPNPMGEMEEKRDFLCLQMGK